MLGPKDKWRDAAKQDELDMPSDVLKKWRPDNPLRRDVGEG